MHMKRIGTRILSVLLIMMMLFGTLPMMAMSVNAAAANGTVARLIEVAKSQIGYKEKASNSKLDSFTDNAGTGNYTKYGKWYKETTKSSGNPNAWCAFFVSWCARQAGIATNVIPNKPNVNSNGFRDWAIQKDRLIDKSKAPKPGDIVILSGHVNIVIGIDEKNKKVTTIGGNESDAVTQSTWSWKGSFFGQPVTGWFRPDYSGVVQSISIKYNVNGGTITSDTYKVTDKLVYKQSPSAVFTANYTGGSNGLHNASTFGLKKTGYAFGGWKNSAGVVFDQTTAYSPSSIGTVGTTVTLSAVWNANTYSVKYNANGGSGTMANSSHTYGTAKVLSENKYTRTGYTFLGWSTSSTTSAATYVNKQSVSNLTTTSGGTFNLYAVWQQNPLVKPLAPTLTLNGTTNEIALNDPITAKFAAVDSAAGYTAKLYKGSGTTAIQTQEVTPTTGVNFTPEEAGQYRVTVYAENEKFVSDESNSIVFNVHAPRTVTFESWDGSEQVREAPYNKPVSSLPTAKSQEGYDFVRWVDESGKEIRSNTVIIKNTVATAEYKIKVFTVEFYEADKKTKIGETQNVAYGQSAVPPAYDAGVFGNKLTDWSVMSDSTLGDYKSVKGNMKLYATIGWADPNSPVAVSIKSVSRDTDGQTFRVNIGYANNVGSANSLENFDGGRIITVLKNAEGKMLASNTTDIYSLDQYTEKQIERVIIYKGDGTPTKAEVVVVGIDKDGNTGGALSNMVQANVIVDSYWGNWSGWSTIVPSSASGRQTETKTQYRAMVTEKKTSSATSLDGYVRDSSVSPNPLITYSAWSSGYTSWSTTKPTASATLDFVAGNSNYQQTVVKSYEMRYYRYQDAKSPYERWYSKNKITSGIRASYGEYSDTATWSVSKLNGATTIANGKKSSSSLSAWGVNKGGETGYLDSAGRIWFKVSENKETQYRYRTRTVASTTYYYTRTIDSGWSDTPVSGTSPQTQTLYRYRDKTDVYVPGGNGDVAVYDVSGKLNLSGNFEGRNATILVYQGKNNDPTAAFLQYVGQTVIGANNSYEFSFNPKDYAPTDKTGDFFVTLSLGGSTGIVTVDVIDAPKKTTAVTFDDGYSGTLVTINVEEGSIAIPPPVQRTGYWFVSWEKTDSNSYIANWEEKEYSVVIVDFANDDIELLTNKKFGASIGELHEPRCDGKIFKGWYYLTDVEVNKKVQSGDVVGGSVVIVAKWEDIEHTIIFVDGDDADNWNIISEQHVIYGNAAELPANFTPGDIIGDKIFLGWSTVDSWWNVTSDLIVQPILTYPETLEAPMILFEHEEDFEDEEDDYFDYDDEHDIDDSPPSNRIIIPITLSGTSNLVHIDGKEGVDYQIKLPINMMSPYGVEDDSIPEGFSHRFTSDMIIEIYSDAIITMMAEADDSVKMNDSEIITIDVPFVNPWDGEEESGGTILFTEWTYALPGDTVDIAVYISDVSGIASMDLGLNFDTNKLILVSSEQGTAFVPGDETGLLITLTFKVADNAVVGDYEILVSVYAKDSLGTDLDIDATTSVVTVFQGGDINNDGEVNAKDVTMLRRYLAGGWDEEFEEVAFDWIATDCNGDGEVDAKDVTRLRRYLAGGWVNDTVLGK